MINAVKNWYDRHLTRDESVILFIILLGALLLLSVLGRRTHAGFCGAGTCVSHARCRQSASEVGVES
jgi:hypothetical protein